MRDEVKKIDINGLSLSIDNKETGRGREIGLFVKYPEFLSLDFYKKNHKLIDNVFWYTVNNFHVMQLTRADILMDTLEKLELKELYDWSESMFSYNDKVAMLDTFIYKGKLESHDVRPYVKIDSGRFEAFTILPGSFADYFVFDSNNSKLYGSTKDFNLPGAIMISVLMIDLMENIERFIVRKEAFDFSVNYQAFGRELLTPIQNEIVEVVEKLISKNKSVRIDTLKVDSETMLEKVKKNRFSKYFISSQTIFNMAILYGKPFKQVEEHLKKI